jgi:hypothetical protein
LATIYFADSHRRNTTVIRIPAHWATRVELKSCSRATAHTIVICSSPTYHPHTRYTVSMSQPSRSTMVQGAKRFLDLEAQVVDSDEDEQDDEDDMRMSSS